MFVVALHLLLKSKETFYQMTIILSVITNRIISRLFLISTINLPVMCPPFQVNVASFLLSRFLMRTNSIAYFHFREKI